MRRAALLLAAALALAGTARANPTMLVGAAENLVVSPSADSKAQLELARSAGLRAIRVDVPWAPGASQPVADALAPYQSAARAAVLTGIRLIVDVVPAQAPADDAARAELASFAAGLATALPTVKDFVVGSEPNRDEQPQAYEALLAAVYDALKSVDPGITVLGGALGPVGQDALGFLQAMGAAYRASGRTQPIMDELDLHVYGASSVQPPVAVLPSYAKLARALGKAFDGTAQTGSSLPIVYDQYGVQTQPPPAKSGLYTDAGSPLAADAVDEATQGADYAQALAIAFCQPDVVGFLFFHTVDDADLAGWQSGLFYPDLTPKSDLPQVRKAIAAARRGALASCPGLALPVELIRLDFDGPGRSLRVGCVRDCVFLATLERVSDGAPVLASRGRLSGGAVQTIRLRARPVDPGVYRLRLRLVGQFNPGPQLVESSAPFTVGSG